MALFFICHSSWEVRWLATIAVKCVHSSVPKISEELLSEFFEWLPVLGEHLEFAKTGYMLEVKLRITYQVLVWQSSLPSKPSSSPSGDVDVDVSQSPLPVPHGQWIVVKSPKHTPPMLDDAIFTDFIGGPFTHMTSTLDSHVKSDPNSLKDISSQVFSIQQIHDSRTMDAIECDSSMTTQSQQYSHAFNLQATVQSIEGGSSLASHSQHCSHGCNVQNAFQSMEFVLTRPMINHDYLGNIWAQTKEWLYRYFHELKKFHFKLPLPLPPIYKSIRMKVSGKLACGIDMKNNTSVGCFKW